VTPTAQQSRARPRPRGPQTDSIAWGVAVPPSQRHAATRRDTARYELVVRRWLRDLARR
jgi:hypothetical protein